MAPRFLIALASSMADSGADKSGIHRFSRDKFEIGSVPQVAEECSELGIGSVNGSMVTC
jgi:hypothetical protein